MHAYEATPAPQPVMYQEAWAPTPGPTMVQMVTAPHQQHQTLVTPQLQQLTPQSMYSSYSSTNHLYGEQQQLYVFPPSIPPSIVPCSASLKQVCGLPLRPHRQRCSPSSCGAKLLCAKERKWTDWSCSIVLALTGRALLCFALVHKMRSKMSLEHKMSLVHMMSLDVQHALDGLPWTCTKVHAARVLDAADAVAGCSSAL